MSRTLPDGKGSRMGIKRLCEALLADVPPEIWETLPVLIRTKLKQARSLAIAVQTRGINPKKDYLPETFYERKP